MTGESTVADNLILLRKMLLIRRFEEKAGQLFGMGVLPGAPSLCIGREAIALGLSAALGETDRLVIGPRPHGALLAMGAQPEALLSAVFSGDPGKAAPPRILWTGFDSSLVPGVAVGASLTGSGAVIALVEKGLLERAEVRSALAMADRLSAPVLTVVEQANAGNAVDGADAEAVKAAASAALAECRRLRKPRQITIRTPQYRGHARSFGPAASAPRDPLDLLRFHLLETGALTPEALRSMDARIKDRINIAAQNAPDQVAA